MIPMLAVGGSNQHSMATNAHHWTLIRLNIVKTRRVHSSVALKQIIAQVKNINVFVKSTVKYVVKQLIQYWKVKIDYRHCQITA